MKKIGDLVTEVWLYRVSRFIGPKGGTVADTDKAKRYLLESKRHSISLPKWLDKEFTHNTEETL